MMFDFVIEVDKIEIEVYKKLCAHLIGFNGRDWGQA